MNLYQDRARRACRPDIIDVTPVRAKHRTSRALHDVRVTPSGLNMVAPLAGMPLLGRAVYALQRALLRLRLRIV